MAQAQEQGEAPCDGSGGVAMRPCCGRAVRRCCAVEAWRWEAAAPVADLAHLGGKVVRVAEALVRGHAHESGRAAAAAWEQRVQERSLERGYGDDSSQESDSWREVHSLLRSSGHFRSRGRQQRTPPREKLQSRSQFPPAFAQGSRAALSRAVRSWPQQQPTSPALVRQP